MNENVVLSGADQDLFGYYGDHERKQEGRGERLNFDFLAALDDLSLHPFMASRYMGNVRRWLLKNWNLGIYYTVEGNRNMIVAVQHLQQDPKKIRAILKTRRPG